MEHILDESLKKALETRVERINQEIKELKELCNKVQDIKVIVVIDKFERETPVYVKLIGEI